MFEAQRKCQLFYEAFQNPSGTYSDSVIPFIHLALQCACSPLKIAASLKLRREWESIQVIFVFLFLPLLLKQYLINNVLLNWITHYLSQVPVESVTDARWGSLALVSPCICSPWNSSASCRNSQLLSVVCPQRLWLVAIWGNLVQTETRWSYCVHLFKSLFWKIQDFFFFYNSLCLERNALFLTHFFFVFQPVHSPQ